MVRPRLFVQNAVAAPADPDLLAIVLNGVPDPGRPAALRTDHHEIAGVDRGLALQNAPLDVLLRIRASVLTHEVHSLDDRPPLGRIHAQDAPRAPLALAGEHLHGVVAAHVRDPALAQRHHGQITSGARETIFMKFFSRSSRATGPKIRVPIGSPASLMSTAAFWSKRI